MWTENGDVIYTVTVVTSNRQPDVIIDSGDGKVLATGTDQEKDGSDHTIDEGSSSTTPLVRNSWPEADSTGPVVRPVG